jgi:hypothetical protein
VRSTSGEVNAAVSIIFVFDVLKVKPIKTIEQVSAEKVTSSRPDYLEKKLPENSSISTTEIIVFNMMV